jgi:hypothetical protein
MSALKARTAELHARNEGSDQRSPTVPFRKFDGVRRLAHQERSRRVELERENALLRLIIIRTLRVYHTLAQDRRKRFEDAGFASPEMFLDAMMTDLRPGVVAGALASLFDGDS